MKALVKRVDYKKMLALALFLALLGLCAVIMPVESHLIPTIDNEEYIGTGLRDPTVSQMNWMSNNVPRVTDVRMNILALERLNQERMLKGLPALSAQDAGAVGAGDELVYSGSSEPLGGDGLPSSVDNSQTAYFPPIRSQGSLGSCVAWATTYYAFTYETNFARGRTASDGNNNMIFSPKWTYNMINYGANSGAYFSDAFYLLTKHGAATWAEFPYDSNYLQWSLNTATWRNAINYRAAGWSQIYNSDTSALIAQLKTQLANGHVMVIGTYVSSWVSTTIKNDTSTTADDAFVNQRIATYMKNTKTGGHGMTLVGYNDNIWCDLNGDGDVDAGEKGAFKIANSWGTGDWNSGFRWVAYDSLYSVSQVHPYGSWPTADRDTKGIFRGSDIYTLTISASYSPKVVAEFTINSLKRGQLYMTLGLGSVTASTPSSTWAAEAIYGSGGSYAFDGTTVARSGTFVFDFTDILSSTTGVNRWFVGLRDSTTGDVATMTTFKLYQVTAGGDVLVASGSGLPKTADGNQSYVWADYQYSSQNSVPIASFLATPTSGVAPLTVSFDGSASTDPDGTITSYQWNYGDGSSGSGASVSHTYVSSGSYTATLTVTDNNGATGSKSAIVTVTAVVPNKAPSAVASASVSSGTAPLLVAFNGSGSSDSDGTIVTYYWSFGDGIYANGKTASHTYINPGNYIATLKVTDDDGATGSSSISITVTATLPNSPPTAVAQSNATNGYAPLQVAFNGAASSDSDGVIASYQWNYGDGATGSGVSGTHVYAIPGNYIAELTVTDDDGAAGTSSIAITVTAAPNMPPSSVAKSNTSSGSAPLYVAFDGSTSSDPDGTIVSYQWSFGDGATASVASPVHCYGSAGTYTATLTVTDDDGSKSTSQISITVAEKTPEVINAPSNLRAKSSGETVILTWKDNSINENGFIIERAVKVKGIISSFQVVGTVGANVVSYRDSSVLPGSYIYRVCAVNTMLGMSPAYSNLVTVQVK